MLTPSTNAPTAVLAELATHGQTHDAAEADRRRKLLNLEPDTARLIELLILNGRRQRILEIGTSNGYSAIWIAATLRRLGGTVPLLTLEREADKVAQARRNVERAGLGDLVRVLEGEATPLVASLEGPFDCVFFDADRISAPEQLRLLLPRLTPDALLLADNVLSHPGEIAGLLAAVEKLPDFRSTVVSVGKGLLVACRAAQAGASAGS